MWGGDTATGAIRGSQEVMPKWERSWLRGVIVELAGMAPLPHWIHSVLADIADHLPLGPWPAQCVFLIWMRRRCIMPWRLPYLPVPSAPLLSTNCSPPSCLHICPRSVVSVGGDGCIMQWRLPAALAVRIADGAKRLSRSSVSTLALAASSAGPLQASQTPMPGEAPRQGGTPLVGPMTP